MKNKILILSGIILLAISATSCSKRCWCYEPDYSGKMVEYETWTDDATMCNTLSYGKRNCVEDYERMDPGQIANPYNR